MTHRVLITRRRVEAITALEKAELVKLQEKLADVLGTMERPQTERGWQDNADMAQWYLTVANEDSMASVWVDTDLCAVMIYEAAKQGFFPTTEGVHYFQKRWHQTAQLPRFVGHSEPPLIKKHRRSRGGL